MKTYILFLYFRRNGVSQDAGEHARCEAENDQEAAKKLLPELRWLRQFYDEVSYEIKQEQVTA